MSKRRKKYDTSLLGFLLVVVVIFVVFIGLIVKGYITRVREQNFWYDMMLFSNTGRSVYCEEQDTIYRLSSENLKGFMSYLSREKSEVWGKKHGKGRLDGSYDPAEQGVIYLYARDGEFTYCLVVEEADDAARITLYGQKGTFCYDISGSGTYRRMRGIVTDTGLSKANSIAGEIPFLTEE